MCGNFLNVWLCRVTAQQPQRAQPPQRHHGADLKGVRTMPPTWLTVTIIIGGIIFSGLYGWFAFEAHGISKDKPKKCSWEFAHQVWFNFAGSAAGWVALWFVAFKASRCVELTCPAEVSSGDLALAGIAFFGVTGYLPFVSLLAATKLAEAVSKVSEAVRK